MPKKVDHDKRAQRVLKAAIEVLAEKDLSCATLGDIATRCGMSRSGLYRYFSNKEDIYYHALKLAGENMFHKYTEVELDGKGHPLDSVMAICDDVMDTAARNAPLIRSLVDSIGGTRRKLDEAVYRRTAKLQLLLRRLLRAGVRDGLVAPCSPEEVVAELIVLLESYCLHLAYFSEANAAVVRTLVHGRLGALRLA